jgi:uncharacterized membrane protein YdjX (TVP38/TMEM64 family)
VRIYGLVAGALLVLLLAMFGVAEALHVPLLSGDPAPWLGRGGPAAAALGVGLLVVDVLLPVPSSLVMVAHGALFGALGGTLLSLVGGTAATLVAFGLGRRGGPWIERHTSAAERARADALVARWGALAILVTRPVPLLAEVTALMAGTSRTLRWGRVAAAAVAGTAPAALLYALTGANAAGLDSAFLMFGLVLAVAGVFWLVGRKLQSAGARA